MEGVTAVEGVTLEGVLGEGGVLRVGDGAGAGGEEEKAEEGKETFQG